MTHCLWVTVGITVFLLFVNKERLYRSQIAYTEMKPKSSIHKRPQVNKRRSPVYILIR